MEGWINVFDNDGMYQSGSGIYQEKEIAEETGKMTKGYLETVFIKFKGIKDAK